MPRILVFGDSIVWGAGDLERGGWVDRFKVYYLNKAKPNEFNEVFNLGNPGRTSTQILGYYENEIKTRTKKQYLQTNRIIIQLGLNDSRYFYETKKTETSLSEFKENLIKLIKISKKYIETIVFVGLFPVDESRSDPVPWSPKIHSFKNEYISEYEKVIKQVCEKEKILFIDIFSEFKRINYKKLLTDGIHPNAEGHELIFQIVKKELEKNKII